MLTPTAVHSGFPGALTARDEVNHIVNIFFAGDEALRTNQDERSRQAMLWT